MKTSPDIAQTLQEIQDKVGETFVYDKTKIEEHLAEQAGMYSNLSIKILSIVGAVLGSIFFTVFLLFTGLYESSVGMVILGLFFIIGAIIMGNTNKSVFLDTLNISVWIIGLFLLESGLLYRTFNIGILAISILIVSVISLVIVKRYILQFLSMLLIGSSLLALIVESRAFALVHFLILFIVSLLTYFHLFEAKLITKNSFYHSAYQPIRMGLIFLLIGTLLYAEKIGPIVETPVNYLWISSLTTIGAILFSIWKILQGLHIENNKTLATIFALSLVILVPTIFTPTISGAILILLLTYHIGDTVGIGIGVVALVYAFIHYYYDLQFTLLVKSIFLFVTGILCLLAYYIMDKGVLQTASKK